MHTYYALLFSLLSPLLSRILFVVFADVGLHLLTLSLPIVLTLISGLLKHESGAQMDIEHLFKGLSEDNMKLQQSE